MYEELLEDIAQGNGLREVNPYLKLAAALGAILLCLLSGSFIAPLAIALLLSLAVLLLARVDPRTYGELFIAPLIFDRKQAEVFLEKRRFGIPLALTHIDWASCDHYRKTGQMMPDDWKAQLEGQDAILVALGQVVGLEDRIAHDIRLLTYRRVSLMPKTTMPMRSPTSRRTSSPIPTTFVFEATWMRTILSSDSTRRLSASDSVRILGS